MSLNSTLDAVTQRIVARSRASRKAYLDRLEAAASEGVTRSSLSCGNLAHGFAASCSEDKQSLKGTTRSNLAIVSAYNDMLSAHQPFHR